MRIIAGTARSLPLKTLPGLHTRPTTDRIKETLFNMLQNDVPGSNFLDLFAGTGQIALEAVSRGASHAWLVDNSRKAAACIQDNIHFTKYDDQCDLMCMDCLAALRQLEHRQVFDIIFMDPPYEEGLELEILQYLAGSDLADADTLIIVETSLQTDIAPYECGGVFEITRDKRYKTNRHVFLKKKQ